MPPTTLRPSARSRAALQAFSRRCAYRASLNARIALCSLALLSSLAAALALPSLAAVFAFAPPDAHAAHGELRLPAQILSIAALALWAWLDLLRLRAHLPDLALLSWARPFASASRISLLAMETFSLRYTRPLAGMPPLGGLDGARLGFASGFPVWESFPSKTPSSLRACFAPIADALRISLWWARTTPAAAMSLALACVALPLILLLAPPALLEFLGLHLLDAARAPASPANPAAPSAASRGFLPRAKAAFAARAQGYVQSLVDEGAADLSEAERSDLSGSTAPTAPSKSSSPRL